MKRDRYDVIIVGGGSAGSALANRLSADGSIQVLVSRSRSTRLPLGRLHPHASSTDDPHWERFYDWKYESEPEPHMNGRKIYHAGARCSEAPRVSTG